MSDGTEYPDDVVTRTARPASTEEVMEFLVALEFAWGIIANSSGGDWRKESAEWQEAAAKWRDKHYYPLLDRF